MSSNGMESWAVDLADVGAVYPFQGSEVLMVIVAVVFWLGWHRMQFKREQQELEDAKKLGDVEEVSRSVERY